VEPFNVEFFGQLGRGIHTSWQAKHFDEASFHEIALAHLNATPPSEHVTPEDVIDWVFTSPNLPTQRDATARFGQPPVTVFSSERFYIDVLFWVDSSTTVHQHGFSGAFHVLSGANIHCEYRFCVERRYSDRMMLGRLELDKVEHMRKGASRPIRAGSGLIHSLFHLDRPSVSVVVRTPSDPLAGPQFNYSRHGLALDPFFLPDSVARETQLLELLHSLQTPGWMARTVTVVRAADAFKAAMLLSKLAILLDDAEYAMLLESVRYPDEDLIRCLARQRDEFIREEVLVRRRTRVRRPEHRFLLALLLNVPGRSKIFSLVEDAYPEAKPRDTVIKWIEELAALRLEDGKNALALELEETSISILGYLMDGANDEQVLERLSDEYDGVYARRDDILATCQAFRRARVFRYLLMP
jgi:hypothetical protein